VKERVDTVRPLPDGFGEVCVPVDELADAEFAQVVVTDEAASATSGDLVAGHVHKGHEPPRNRVERPIEP
jgi:hypothetical protein